MADKPRTVIKELAVFDIGLGLLAGLGAYFALTQLDGAPPLYGYERKYAIGLPLLIIALSNVGAGVGLLFSRTALWVYLCAFAGMLPPLFYFGFMCVVVGGPGINLVTIVMAAIPIVLIARFLKALDELRTAVNDSAA